MASRLRAQGLRMPAPGARHRSNGGEIHVWIAPLELPPVTLAALRQTLSQGELARAAAFRFPCDRDRFISAHGTLRRLLAAYIGITPSELQFGRNTSGKPVLNRCSFGKTLRFNMSYSRSTALFGVALDREIGVDIEYEDPGVFNKNMRVESFTLAERSVIDSLAPAERTHASFRYWTLKEAFVKARGAGLSYPPRLLDVSSLPAGSPRILSSDAGSADCIDWTLRSLPAPPGFAAAVACNATGCRIVCGQLGEFDAETWKVPGFTQRPLGSCAKG
ncbi:MAG: 4'-phosphopantetheinyl transferase superfamily protein [Candidatus Krumholzibacteria bacterium]|nr:4'-phosphopantetheinyl transferase superfamily protein [Candidatus Krumholzibacteria bacterium]